ncbi:response regulator transcription factor [Pseudanabaena sp. ABRG5-3]|uniref:response regulator transcription factor n=1 Tax=Pseudanabaena sp. ABRG5-3 TaxID=685565 RepID=UPI000DC71A61|nr:response regulator transcription factor [Pseudanabaena sp. ABRG5-3]BBC23735.1 two-component response regulator [Pseudanabaena sp. ABRG5-3]
MQRILVIEDDDEIRDEIIDILELKGFVTEGASNGRIGLEAAKKKHPELILCDVDMPELNGYGVLKNLQQDPDLEDIPFIFLTALSSMDNLRKGMNLGADDYLTKPLQIDQLLTAIATRLLKQAKSNNHKIGSIPHSNTTPQQVSARQISETSRLTPRQSRILQLVNQGKPIVEIADELAVSIDAAELLADIAVRLNHRLNLNQHTEIAPQLLVPKIAISIPDDLLTPRQREILKLVANGMTTKEIAEFLFISVKTVETHRGQLMDRLNIHDLAGLIRYALRVGLINLDA